MAKTAEQRAKRIDRHAVSVDAGKKLIRLDGVPLSSVPAKVEAGVMVLRFLDTSRARAEARGSRYVEIPIEELLIGLLTACHPEPE